MSVAATTGKARLCPLEITACKQGRRGNSLECGGCVSKFMVIEL